MRSRARYLVQELEPGKPATRIARRDAAIPIEVLRVEEPVENSEDARLIAAVPELVAAIHELLDACGGNMETERYNQLRALAGYRGPSIAASQAVAPPEPVAEVVWYPYPHEPSRHYAMHDGPLEIEVYQTEAIAPCWYWDVSLGSGSFSLTGGVADTIDAAKTAAIAAARAWRDSIRL